MSIDDVAFISGGFIETFSMLFSLDIALKGVTDHEPSHDKTNKVASAPNKDSDQPGHLPSLIRVFAVRSMGS